MTATASDGSIFALTDVTTAAIIDVRDHAGLNEPAALVLPDGWLIELVVPDPIEDGPPEAPVRWIATVHAPYGIAPEHWTMTMHARARVLLDLLIVGVGDEASDEEVQYPDSLTVVRLATAAEAAGLIALSVDRLFERLGIDDDPDPGRHP